MMEKFSWEWDVKEWTEGEEEEEKVESTKANCLYFRIWQDSLEARTTFLWAQMRAGPGAIWLKTGVYYRGPV